MLTNTLKNGSDNFSGRLNGVMKKTCDLGALKKVKTKMNANGFYIRIYLLITAKEVLFVYIVVI